MEAGTLPRRATSPITEALIDTRVVLISGGRGVGKHTLARHVAGHAAEYRDLDTLRDRIAATTDPSGFIRAEQRLVIHEIQHTPSLLLAVKAAVDEDPRPGRFLLTASSQLFGMLGAIDALPGRMETIDLWPLSQGEIDAAPDGFIDTAFAATGALQVVSDLSRADYARRIVRGGLPRAVSQHDPHRRSQLHDIYLRSLIDRELCLPDVHRHDDVRRLIRLLATLAGTTLPAGNPRAGLGPSLPASRYLQALEEAFLIRRIPGWPRNRSVRAAPREPALIFVDSGIAAHVLTVDAYALLRNKALFDRLLTAFTLSELHRQRTWSQTQVEIYHYREQADHGIGAVVEDRLGRVVVVAVTAASTVGSDNLGGLRRLVDHLGDECLIGVLLYTGRTTQSFGDRLRAMPVSALWQTPPP